MRVRAQVGMVMSLDKCIGCHTCSVTCKNVWTNRKGAEYIWFNDVETKPGVGYPKRWEDQEHWRGGWELDRKGKLQLKAGGKVRKLANLFFNPDLPTLEDYYEPWTYDYEHLTSAPPSEHQPVAQPHSQVDGRRMSLEWGPNWEDDLAGSQVYARQDPNLRAAAEEAVKLEYEQAFMFYLPRICEHCINPSCVASCPSGAMYKREEDGIVLVDQEACRSWRFCVSGCPYKKVYFNWATGKAEKCTFCYPRIEAGQPTVCSETCVGKIRFLGIVLYDADRVEAAASVPDEHDLLCRHRVALPLHPEFRTLPMVWYVPPLSPVLEFAAGPAGDADPDDVFPAIDDLRIPISYLANLLAAGDEEPVRLALRRQAAMRRVMRERQLGAEPDPALAGDVGMSLGQLEDLYRLLAISKYEDRYVIPQAHAETAGDLYAAQGSCGYDVTPAQGISFGEPQVDLVRMLEDRG